MVEVAQPADGETQQQALAPLTEEQKAEALAQFESIIYTNLDKILEKRPAFPVTKFAKSILLDVNLEENGDPILKKEKKKKDKKKKDKKKRRGDEEEEQKEDDAPKKKDKKKKKAAE